MSESECGELQISRHLGIGVKVDTAPPRTKIAVGYLASPNTYLRIEHGDIVFADQVVYRITGYDPRDYTLMLDLIKDWRPGEKDDPNADTQP